MKVAVASVEPVTSEFERLRKKMGWEAAGETLAGARPFETYAYSLVRSFPAREYYSDRRAADEVAAAKAQAAAHEAEYEKLRAAKLGRPVLPSFEALIQAVAADCRKQGLDAVVLCDSRAVAVTAAAVDLVIAAAEAAPASEVVIHTQFPGLLPVLLRRAALERWAAEGKPRAPDLLVDPAALYDLGPTTDIELLERDAGPPARVWPIGGGDMALIEHWTATRVEIAPLLAPAWRGDAAARNSLGAALKNYRDQFSSALESYQITGGLEDLEALFRDAKLSGKPWSDYFIIAAHYGIFLQKFAGLTGRSHVVDIGCSWGYLGFSLANLLYREGAYIGIEVQKASAEFGQRWLEFLKPLVTIHRLDIENTFYNPAGEIGNTAFRLPIEDRWADNIVAGSVFTHMREEAVAKYFDEFRRILKPGGIAAFSYDDSTFFGRKGQDYQIKSAEDPDRKTYYSRHRITQLIEAAGLKAARAPVNMSQFGRRDYQTWFFATPS